MSFDEIPATEAHRLAGISYRQLDYWARQGWVMPSIDTGSGRAGRRLYSRADVVRLALLAHLGRSRHDIGRAGPRVAGIALPVHDDFLVVADEEDDVWIVEPSTLRSVVSRPGSFTVFDPAPLRRRLRLTKPSPREVRSA